MGGAANLGGIGDWAAPVNSLSLWEPSISRASRQVAQQSLGGALRDYFSNPDKYSASVLPSPAPMLP